MNISIRSRLALAVVTLLSMSAVSCTSSSSSNKATGIVSDDMNQIMGVWERQADPAEKVSYKRSIKDIGNGHETVTYYNADGTVLRQHQVDFKLERYGGAKVYTYRNQRETAGSKKGTKKPGTASYLYRINEDQLTEVWGLLPGQEKVPVKAYTHIRIKNAATQQAKKATH